MKPYPAYKDSGLPWLGPIPAHWETRRLKHTVEGCINGIWGEEPDGANDIVCVRVADFDREHRRVKLTSPAYRAVTPKERTGRLLRKWNLLEELMANMNRWHAEEGRPPV